jgi:type II secretory pathway pseudopilin PulG
MMMLMKKTASYVFSNRGVTLVEILVSIVILFIIIMSLLPMFVQSSRSNYYSKSMMDATYLAQTNLEELYHLSTTTTFADGLIKLKSDKGFTEAVVCPAGYCYEKESNGYFLFIQLKDSGNNNGLMNGKINIYSDKTKTKKKAQMEMLLHWKDE